ncbi:MAG: tetratricopeptide repeat protein, partial [Deltaproteobacteria bacterium]|nr:tetratricopeptide repeat protein [Deltaproteobacteria bacterium]
GQAWLLLMEPLHPLGFVAAVVGVGLLARRRLAAAAALLLVATGTALSQSLVSSDDIDPFNPDLHGYFLAAQAVLAITVACCAGWLARAVSAVQERTAALSARAVRLVQVLLLALLACLPLRSLCLAGEPLAFARLRAPEIVARAILDPLPPHAVAVTSDFSTVFLLWSAQAAGEARPDVAVVHRNYLPFPGWVEREARFQPDLLPLLRLLRHPDAAFDPALGPPLRRPLYVEPYHNLGAAIAAGLRPAGLLHRWEPGGARPGEAQPRFWQEIYHRLGPADLADPQTRRYLFWQHVLQGQQYRASGAPAAALQELERALALAPESPEVLAMAGELRGREPSPPADPSRQLRPGTGRHLPPRR